MWRSLSLVMMSANIRYYAGYVSLNDPGLGREKPSVSCIKMSPGVEQFYILLFSHIEESFILKRL